MAQSAESIVGSADMSAMNERRAHMILRGSVLCATVLSVISLASAFDWLTLGKAQTLALAIALAATGLGMWVPSRWLRKRQLAL